MVHKCLVNKKLKDISKEMYDSLEEKGYCINEILCILSLMQAEVNIRASINALYDQLEPILPTKPDETRGAG